MPDLENIIIKIRETLERAYDSLLKRAGFFEDESKTRDPLPEFREIHERIKSVIEADKTLYGYKKARQKFIDEASFTLFNRLIGIKVMEVRGIISDTVVTKSVSTDGKSVKHFLYISKHPEANSKPGQGINEVLKEVFQELSAELPQLYGNNPYGFLPFGNDTMNVIDLINLISQDEWKKSDILGWLYQFYQDEEKKKMYKALSNKKKISNERELTAITQFYTEDYIIKFLVENTLGREWMEMHPQSKLIDEMNFFDKNIPLVPKKTKKVQEIKVFDPSCGSGSFLLHAFDLFYGMYLEENGFSENIPDEIIKNNLYGLDIDERAIQITALSLYLKTKTISKNSKLTSSNLFSISMGEMNDRKLNNFIESLDIPNGIYKNFVDTVTRLKSLNMIGSLFRIKPLKGKLTKEKTMKIADDLEENYYLEVSKKIDELIKLLPEQHDAVSALINQNYKKELNGISLLFKKYDVVITNPPYLDSGKLLEYMKKYLKDYYPNSYADMYSAFIEKCIDLTEKDGFLGMITMQSFMFISSHKKLRELILKKSRFVSTVHLGPGAFKSINGEIVNTVMFTLRKGHERFESVFHDVKEFEHDSKIEAISKCLEKKIPNRTFRLLQEKFSAIPGSPFVYWISDEIRDLFKKYEPLEKYANVVQGLATADNDRFLRYWWEVNGKDISKDYKVDHKKWVMYAKGGPYNKWYGNLWWVVNWKDDGEELKNFSGSVIRNESYYFREGLTYSFVSSLGFTTRYLPPNSIFDVGGSPMFPKIPIHSEYLAIMNSKLISHIMSILNPTVNYQVGDLKNIPIADFNSTNSLLQTLANDNMLIKKALYSFHIMERDFKRDPVSWGLESLHESDIPKDKLVHEAVKAFFIKKAELEARLLVNEAKIDEEVFRLYGLFPESYSILDAIMSVESGAVPENLKAVAEVLSSEGIPAGMYPRRELSDSERKELKKLYLTHRHDRGSGKSKAINGMEFGIVEEISTKLKINPESVVNEIKKIDELPPEAVKDVVIEHIQAMVIEIMHEDKDGIVSLDSFTNEKPLFERLKEKWQDLGIRNHYDELEKLLGSDIDKYLLIKFFSDHTKRFKNRPIIWHLVSYSKNFNFFVLHHKWSSDKLLSIKSEYLAKIKSTMNNILSAETDDKKRLEINDRLKEIEAMEEKIDSLLRNGYDPKVDDGVAKNLAYLQKYGLVRGKPLSSKLVNKMLDVRKRG